MSRTGSPSHSRRDSGQNSFTNASQPGTHGFRARPSGVPSSSGGGRLNAGRVPSPAAAAAAAPPPQAAMGGRSIGQLLGRAVRLKLHDGGAAGAERWVEGQVWCYDPIPGVVVLEAAGSKGRQSFRMVKVNQVRELQLVPQDGPPPPPATVAKILEPVKPVNVTAVAMREAQAVKADDARRARIGHGVSRWAQEIFDALGKTLPVRWHNTSIIILDDVLLPGPLYRPEDAKASESNSARLARVRQVLEGEWARLLRTEEGRSMEAEARNAKG